MKKLLLLSVLTLLLIGLAAKIYTASLSNKLNLITVLYNETDPQRIQEYKTCLERNLAHPSIRAIHIIYDTAKDTGANELLEYLKTQKVTISYISGRPSFAHCFNMANNLFPNSKVMVSNADIYFNNTLKLLEKYDLNNVMLAITRKEVNSDGSLTYMRGTPVRGQKEASQDVWIFATPFPQLKRDDIYLGTLHCESELAHQVNELGYKVINPFFSIDCLHLHLSGVRHWQERAYPSHDVYMTTLGDLSEISK